jgi:hypothetical protein
MRTIIIILAVVGVIALLFMLMRGRGRTGL